MLVVIGIIVLIILIAVPAIRSLTGTRSVDAAQNTLSALITRAREEAVGIQDYRGVFFYLDPKDDTMKGLIVMNAGPTSIDNVNAPVDVYLDAEGNHDFLPLPGGVGIQCINDGGSEGFADRYIGFNQSNGLSPNYRYGGVILFDGFGRLVSVRYALKLVTSANTPSNLANVFGITGATSDFVPPVPLRSQFGFVLYDREAFIAANGSDGDTVLDNPPNDEPTEETWLDNHSTPILINRYTGTLIRAE